jgi:hypothetical protein
MANATLRPFRSSGERKLWLYPSPYDILQKIIETLALTGFEGLISSKISDSYGALRYRS